MTKEQSNYIKLIKTMKRSQVIGFIRACLTNDDGEKLKFNMSGYDSFDASDSLSKMGSCTVHNQKVLNVFAYLGLYDYTDFLFLDFYKGGSRLYFKYWNEDELYINETFTNGHSTSEIIYEIFTLTILSNKNTRRRLDYE